MIIFFYGSDSYRLHKKLQEIKKRAKELVFVDSYDEFQSANKSNSLFGAKKAIIINKLSEEFNNIVGADLVSAQSNIIVFCDEKPDKRTKLFKKLLKIAQCEEFKLLENYELIKWVQEYANCDFAIANKLSTYIGNDLWLMSNEINKLKAYIGYANLISDSDIERLIKAKISNNIFKTIDALAIGDKKTALSLLTNHLAAGDDENYLFNMFCYQFRNILKIKFNNFSGLHPFVIQKTRAMAQKYSLEKIKIIFSDLLKLDLWSKTSKVSQPATFFLLLCSF
ncbi:MAG: DNA polymerase III subunit delta [bacterium]